MIKFGVALIQDGLTYGTIRKVAHECERLGLDSLWFADHFVSYPYPEQDFLECWTVMSALASDTTTLRLGPLVLNNMYRYPSILAKMGSTLDVISDGRLEFGIGAGGAMRARWHSKAGYGEEFVQYGVPFPRIKERIQRLREALCIIRKMWTEEKASFQGKYYAIEEAFCNPKPIQEPYPPIWIGGSGEKHMLRVVAEFADVWNIAQSSPEEYERKAKVLERHCISVGRKPTEIQKSLFTTLVVSKTEAGFINKLQKIRDCWGSVPTYDIYVWLALRPGAIKGTTEQCIKKMESYIKLGVTRFIFYLPDIKELEPLRVFSEQIIPHF